MPRPDRNAHLRRINVECCRVEPGLWQHGSGCPSPGGCWCHDKQPRMLRPYETQPSAHCMWPIDGDPDNDIACGAPAYVLMIVADDYGRPVEEVECIEHAPDALFAAISVWFSEAVQIYPTVVEGESTWQQARKAWRQTMRLARAQGRDNADRKLKARQAKSEEARSRATR